MLKAMTGITLPDDTRIEANTVLDDVDIDDEILERLIAKGAVAFVVEEDPDEDLTDGTEDAAPEAVEAAPELSEPEPTPTPKKRRKAAVSPAASEEANDGTAR